MIASIFGIIADVIRWLFAKEQKREEIRQRTAETFRELDGSAQDLGNLRESYEGLRERAKREAQDAEKPPTPPSPPPSDLGIAAPARAKVNEVFFVSLSRPEPGADLFADNWRLYSLVDGKTRYDVILNGSGKRAIRVVRDGEELARVVVEIEGG